MRHEWYGDKRDLLKWATLVRLAREHAAAILWVWMLTDDKAKYRFEKPDAAGFPGEVTKHFRDLRDIDRLAKGAVVEVECYEERYQGAGDAYFTRLDTWIRERYSGSLRPVILFLDPDTGLEPESGTARGKHIHPDRITRLFGILRLSDSLVLYQHQWRETAWKEITIRNLASALGCDESEITVYSSKVAADVALFAHTKAVPA